MVVFLVIIMILIRFQDPFHGEVEHKLGVKCFTGGPVVCRVRLDRGGYVPGENIILNASIHNRSKIAIKQTKATLTEVCILIRFR